MAAVPITIVGIETRSDGSSDNVTIVGMASVTLGTWGGGNVPMPSPPIANVPGAPGYHPPGGGGGQPPGIWGPTDPRPTPPIANAPGVGPNPDPPGKPEEPIQPPVEWKPIWAGPEHGWVVVGIPQGEHVAPST